MRTGTKKTSAARKEYYRNRYKTKKQLVKGYIRNSNYGPGANEHYHKAHKQQKGRCAICNKRMSPPCFDHRHKPVLFRGLLCSGCNVALGGLEKIIGSKRGRAYLKKWRIL